MIMIKPVLLRWLSTQRRLKIAAAIRDKAAALAEWIAPELKGEQSND